MKKLLLTAMLLCASLAFASGDPCASPDRTKQSASVAFTTNTTVILVTNAQGRRTYVCSINLTMTSGTTPTLAFQYGTGSTCGTGTVTLTGTMALPTTSGTVVTFGNGSTLFYAEKNTDLCMVTGGTSPTGNGWITYVQE